MSKGENGLFWISTYSGLYIALSNPFELFGSRTNPGLRGVIDIESDHNEGLWIVTYEGIFHKKNDSNDFIPLESIFPEAGITNKRIMTFAGYEDGVWIGYRATGVEHYSKKFRKLSEYRSDSKDYIASNSVSEMLVLNTGDVLVGTYGGGLSLIETDGSVTSVPQTKYTNSAADQFIVMLHQTKDNKIWVGTEGGLYDYDLSTNRLKPYSFGSDLTRLSSTPTIWTMAESATGAVWFGTQHHGLLTLQEGNGGVQTELTLSSFNIFPKPNSLIIYAIEMDGRGSVWSSTNHGLVRTDPTSGVSKIFLKNHGLQETDFEKGASHKDDQGRLYFGGSNGYNRFDPSDVRQNLNPSDVIIADINIAGERPVAPMMIPELEEIELTHEDYTVTFTFSVLDFLDVDNNQYRYKLVNFDPEWVENGTKNDATYTNLPAGLYTLLVQGANSEGIWNRDGVSLDIRVLPSKYNTWWAYCCYALLALVLLALSIKYYRNSVRKQEAEFAAEVANNATEKAVDDLHDQLDYQDELVKAVYQHNVNTLDLVRDCINRESHGRPEFTTRKATVNDMNRVAALTVLEDCLFYQNETLLADLHKYTELLLVKLIDESVIPAERVITINAVSQRKLPVAVASPLALVLYELLENALTHAFSVDSPVNYLEIEMDWPERNGKPGDDMVLVVRDSGVGLPEGFSPEMAGSSGLAIVALLATELSAELEFSKGQGTSVSLTMPDPLRML